MTEKYFHTEMMQYYEEVLAQSARNYAFTSDQKWERRYIEYEKLSDKLLKQAIKNADSKIKDFFIKMDISNMNLIKMELLAIDFVNNKKLEKAIELLDSREYLQERKVMAKGLETFVKERFDKVLTFSVMSKTVNDVIELEKRLEALETQLKTEKFTTIGKFASRLTHDLRNPLSVIKVTVENLRLLYDIDEEKQAHFERINRAIDRITHQVDDVLNFIKGELAEIDSTSFIDILKESLDSLVIPDKIKIIIPKNNINLICDKKQFSAAMNNLILNGIQSIDGVGTIEITIEENDNEHIIQVKDSGKGIPKDKLEKVFEPMYTTKQHGTGLGLVSVKSIVESHGGVISVTSLPTIFTITLPKFT